MTQVFDLEGHGPPTYERFLVPAIFAECAGQLLDVARPVAGDRVIDVACGTGIVARLAASRTGLARVVGVDANDEMLTVARASGYGHTIEWSCADAKALPFPPASFDIVYCQHGLQYVDDPLAALREMARVLVPGGRVALAVWRPVEHSPGFAALVDALDRLVGPEAADIMRGPFAGPEGEPLRRLLARAGFDATAGRAATVAARFPSPDEFLRVQVLASPRDGLARLTVEAGEGRAPRWDMVAAELSRTLSPYVDDGGLLLSMQTWLVTAIRSPVSVARPG